MKHLPAVMAAEYEYANVRRREQADVSATAMGTMRRGAHVGSSWNRLPGKARALVTAAFLDQAIGDYIPVRETGRMTHFRTSALDSRSRTDGR